MKRVADLAVNRTSKLGSIQINGVPYTLNTKNKMCE